MSPGAIGLIAKSEFMRRLRQRSFLLGVVGLPFIVTLVAVVAIVLASSKSSLTLPVVYVDQSGVLQNARPLPDESNSLLQAMSSEDEAREAVQQSRAAAAFVLPPEYPQTARAIAYSKGDLPEAAEDLFERFLVWNLMRDRPEELAIRALKGIDLTVRSLDGSREIGEDSWPNIIIPFVAAMLMFVVAISNAPYAMQSITEEKETRTMEILVTSVSPEDVVVGKILAVFFAGIFQVAIWTVTATVALAVAMSRVEELSQFRPDWTFVGLVLVLFVLAHALITCLLAILGAVSSETREGQQLATMVVFPVMVPIWAATVIIGNPNGLLAVLLSFFPLTAPMTLSMRWTFAVVPTWQVALSILMLLMSAVGSAYLAARVFRVGMLRYGKRLTWAEVRGAVRGRRRE